MEPLAPGGSASVAMAPPIDTAAHESPSPDQRLIVRWRRRRWVTVLGLALLGVVVAYGFVLRAWLVAHTPLTSDQAVVGLMARAAMAGHFSTFYWGQAYGGAEPYVAIPFVWATHGSPFALGATAAFCWAVAAVVIGVAVALVTGRRFIGVAAGTLAWVWPYAVVWNSLRESGFRAVNVVCGLIMIYAAVRIHRGGNRWGNGAVLGLAVGVGWWSSPEIAYFAVPTAVVLAASWKRAFARGARWSRPWHPGPVVVACGAAVLGALPWLVTNIGSSFASLRASSLPTYHGIGYVGRLSVFFRAMLPVQLGVRSVPGGQWAVGPVAGPVLYGLLVAVLVVSLVRAVVPGRRGRAAAPAMGAACGVLAFPFLYAAVPSTAYWLDGRYGVALPALVILTVAMAWVGVPDTGDVPARPRRARHMRRRAVGPTGVAVACASVLAGAVLTVATAQASGVPDRPSAFFSGWSNPEQPAQTVDNELLSHGIHDAYADYWVAYVLDDLAYGRLFVSPSSLDVRRWPAATAAVLRAPRQAWLFVAPGHGLAADQAFGNPEPGPGGYSETVFKWLLAEQAVAFRVVHLGVLDAVVPDRRVTLPRP